MNAPLPFLPSAPVIPRLDRKKRVLLVDASTQKRDVRAEAMRRLGMDVDCAADILEARCWWRPKLYDLVLINQEKGRGHRDKFCEDIRNAQPPQRFAFLVGHPGYLADFPNEDASLAPDVEDPLLTARSKIGSGRRIERYGAAMGNSRSFPADFSRSFRLHGSHPCHAG